MRSVVLTLCIWPSHPKYKEDCLLRHCWTTSIFALERKSMLDSSIGLSEKKIEEFLTCCGVCWLEPFNLLCYRYIFTEALGKLELTLKFPFSCSTAEEVICVYQNPAKFSIHSTTNSLVGWVGNFVWEHRHIVWQWLLLLFLTLDKTKTINKFSELHQLLVTKIQVTEIIYNISTFAFEIRLWMYFKMSYWMYMKVLKKWNNFFFL